MFTMTCKTTGWCAVALATGDGSGMRNYDIASGGVASGNNYLDVSGMDFIQYKRVSMGLTDCRKTAKNLVDSRKNWKILTVSRK